MHFGKGLRSKHVLVAGATIGFAAGLVMAVAAMTLGGLGGESVWWTMRHTAAVALGAQAVHKGAGSVVVGLGIHILWAVMLGTGFAALMQRHISGFCGIIPGAIYGAAVFGVVTYLLLPSVDALLYQRLNNGWMLLYHLAVGATLGLMVRLAQSLGGREPSKLLRQHRA